MQIVDHEKRIIMKKLITIILSLMMVLAFAACGNQQAEEEAVTEPSEQEESETGDASAATGNAIVVYFSASGNTKRVAELVADETGADLFELIPTEAYSDDDLDWTDDSSRVNKEHDDPDLQDIELTSIDVPDWDNYDTVLVGYPIWWGEAAWPVNSFIKEFDFTGKQVIPFCTSASSGLGESGSKLEQMAGTGNWLEGMRFSEDEEESEIREWVQNLNLK